MPKKYIPRTNIFSIIIYKFSYWYKFYRVTLLKVDKSLKIRFYYTIFIVDLFFDLSIESNEKLMLNFEKIV